jgi:hypothetical protein
MFFPSSGTAVLLDNFALSPMLSAWTSNRVRASGLMLAGRVNPTLSLLSYPQNSAINSTVAPRSAYRSSRSPADPLLHGQFTRNE